MAVAGESTRIFSSLYCSHRLDKLPLPDSETYSNVKDPAVDLIYFPAEKWAAETGWQQGVTDA